MNLASELRLTDLCMKMYSLIINKIVRGINITFNVHSFSTINLKVFILNFSTLLLRYFVYIFTEYSDRFS